MTEWICRFKPCWILIDDAFKKVYLEDWQLLKNGHYFNPIDDSWQALPIATDSTTVRRSENKDGTVKHEQAVGQPGAPAWLFGRLGKIGGTTASPKALVQFYSPEAAQSLSWTSGTVVSKWRDPVRLSGRCLLHPRPFRYVGEARPQCYLRTTYGWRSKGRRRTSWGSCAKARVTRSRIFLR